VGSRLDRVSCRQGSNVVEKLILDETEKWANVIKFAGIKPE